MTVQTLAALPHKGRYAAAWRRLLDACAVDPAQIVSLAWNDQRSASDARAEFVACMHRRINKRGGIPDAYGRKDDWFYHDQLWRDQRAISDRTLKRVRVYQFETAEARSRFAHLLSSRED